VKPEELKTAAQAWLAVVALVGLIHDRYVDGKQLQSADVNMLVAANEAAHQLMVRYGGAAPGVPPIDKPLNPALPPLPPEP
jgi:hypothetical protein